MAPKVRVDGGDAAKTLDNINVTAPQRVNVSDIDYNRGSMGITAPRMPDVNSRNWFTNARTLVGDAARGAGDAIQRGWGAIRGGPKKPGNLVDGATTKPKPLPDADVPKTKQDLVDGGAKDGGALDDAIKNGDELAKDPSVAKTLQKWGLRGGIGVCFLMLIYDTANPFEAIGKGAKDAKKGAEGAGDIFSSLFEAFKGILEFLKNNVVVSVSSSICCVLLIMLPMLMQGARRIAPRPYYGGQY